MLILIVINWNKSNSANLEIALFGDEKSYITLIKDIKIGVLTGDVENKTPLINLIPFSISSVTSRNNYQPTPLVGDEADRVIDRINQYSSGLNFSY